MNNMKLTSCNIKPAVYRCSLSLLDCYTDNKIGLSPSDFIQQNESVIHKLKDYESVVDIFLWVTQHMQFFTDVTNYFYSLEKRDDQNDQNNLMILSLLIFKILNSSNKSKVMDVLREEDPKKVLPLLIFFQNSHIRKELVKTGSKYYEEEYVCSLIENLVKSNNLIQELINNFEQLLKTKMKIKTKKSSNVNMGPSLENILLQTNKLPLLNLTTLKDHNKHTLEELEDKVTSLELSKSQENLTCNIGLGLPASNSNLKSEIKEESTRMNKTKRAHGQKVIKQLSRDNFPVKKNAATILREAARVINEEEKEVLKLNELVSGGMDFKRYEQLEEEARLMDEAIELQEIQRKHLLGLLSREEAIIAKHRLQKTNKEKRIQIEKEKKEMNEIIKQIELEHNERIKKIVENTQKIHKNIAEQKKNILGKKQKGAQELAELNRQLYEQCILKQKQELEEKIKIIKQIKELSTIKDIQGNSFDPTETMNVGLLCEMSLNELRERLKLDKVCFRKKIEDRKNCILEKKIRQKQILMETQQFLENWREERREINKMAKGKLAMSKIIVETAEIAQLRDKLETAKKKTMKLKSIKN